jgi:hypothetical protein
MRTTMNTLNTRRPRRSKWLKNLLIEFAIGVALILLFKFAPLLRSLL